jgi:NIPSNAP
MIHELRTYTIKTEYGGVGELERRFGNGIDVRLKYSQLGGFFHTRAGPLSQVVHIWPYDGLRNRAEARAAANRDQSNRWPPGIGELFERQEVEILLPAPFMRPLRSQYLGPLWELSWFDYSPHNVREALTAFETCVPKREKQYPVVGCWTVDVGPSSGRIYILAPFKGWEHRDEVLATIEAEGSWPPKPTCPASGAGSKLLEPAHFSPLQ